MIVHNLNLIGLPIVPPEADAPPVVDANAMLTNAITLQSFEPVSSNACQVVKISRRMKPTQPFLRSSLDALKLPAAEAVMQCFGFCTSK
jgi:hypothetical protein